MMMEPAIFSRCRCYRYTLTREWIGGDGYAMFVGLNPSTADETKNDPTIRRCVAFAKSWGYAGLVMTNLFAWRATEPKEMKRVSYPIGTENDRYLIDMASVAAVVVAAWGRDGKYMNRAAEVRSLLPNMHHLGLTKSRQPRHPLYLKADLTPQAWIGS